MNKSAGSLLVRVFGAQVMVVSLGTLIVYPTNSFAQVGFAFGTLLFTIGQVYLA